MITKHADLPVEQAPWFALPTPARIRRRLCVPNFASSTFLRGTLVRRLHGTGRACDLVWHRSLPTTRLRARLVTTECVKGKTLIAASPAPAPGRSCLSGGDRGGRLWLETCYRQVTTWEIRPADGTGRVPGRRGRAGREQ